MTSVGIRKTGHVSVWRVWKREFGQKPREMNSQKLTVRLQSLPGFGRHSVSVSVVSVEVSPVPLVDILLGVGVVSVVVVSLMLLLLMLLLMLLEVIVSVGILSFSVISSCDVTICSNGLTIRVLNVP